MSLTLHKRYELVFLATHKNGPKLGPHKIAKIVNCNWKTVTRWLNRWEKTKDLSDRPRSGAPRITTTEQDQTMIDMALAEINATSKTIQQELQDSEVNAEPSSSKSNLEQLPNEVLIYIFQFLSPYDLHRAIYNLNLRLNTICYTQKFYLNLTWTKRAFDYYCSNQQPFASQIYSLKLSDQYDRLTVALRHIDISLFTNLRTLAIREPSPENLDLILSKLYLLPHLSNLNIYSALIQSAHITTALFSIRPLRCLTLYSFEPILLHFTNDAIHPFATLEYLELNNCYMTDFLELLKYVGPHVKRMKIDLLYKRREDPASIDRRIIDNLRCGDGGQFQIPVSLQRLQISFNYLPLTDFHIVLELFPNLRHLTFSTSTFDMEFASATIWHQFITTNLLNLEKLQFYIQITGTVAQQRPSAELVHSFNYTNSIWIDGPVIMDYNVLLKPRSLEFYTFSQPSSGGKYSVEFYGKERHMTVTNGTVNIDKNITKLKITLHDDQQSAATDQLLMEEKVAVYPKVTKITIHSQMTTTEMENDLRSSFICSDLMKAIPDLSKITALDFTTDSPTNAAYPSRTLVRQLLSKMQKVQRLFLPYDYLLHFLESPLIVQILTQQIDFLWITFYTNPPLLQDMIQIFNVFSTNLRFLYFNLHIDFPVDNFYRILPLLLCGKCTKLLHFELRLRKQQPPQFFNEEFKLWLKECLTALVDTNNKRSIVMEYKIKDNDFFVSW